MNISKIKDQHQEIGEKISDSKWITVEINALPEDQDDFASSICAKK